MSGEPWTTAELALLREVFPRSDQKELLSALPSRTLAGIRAVARLRGIKRAINKRTRWTEAEQNTMRRLYPLAEKSEVLAALPGRAWGSIVKFACELSISRPTAAVRARGFVAPIVAELYTERVRRRMKRAELCRKIGHAVGDVLHWELGRRVPRLLVVYDWAAVFGLEPVLRPTAERLLSEGAARPSREKLMAGRA